MSGLTKVRDTTNDKNVYLSVDGFGQLSVKDSDLLTALSGTLYVDGSSVTQPVSLMDLPLPYGAATDTLQGDANASLSSIDSKLSGTISVSSGISRTASILKSAASVIAADTSVSIDMSSHSKLAIYGESSDNTQRLVVQVSDDGMVWYDSKDSFYANGSNGHYHGVHEAITKYARIMYSNTATETTKITKYL